MENEVLLSIIIPIYNPKIYDIEKCLDSVRLIKGNTEVLLIDDGSADTQVNEFCKKYILHYRNFKYYYQDNKGVSAARNLGLSKAKGRYISFVDVDDTVNVSAINDFDLEMFQDADLILFDVLEIDPYGEERRRTIFTYESGYISKEEVIKCFILTPKLSECWGKLYRNESIRRNNITFPAGVEQGEDAIFNSSYLQNISRIYYQKEVFYNYNTALNNTILRFVRDPLNRLRDILETYYNISSLVNNTFDTKEQKVYTEKVDNLYTYGFGCKLLILSEHNLINQDIRDFVNHEVRPNVLKNVKSILKKKPKACIYDLIIRNNLWFVFNILKHFKRAAS